MFLKKTGVFQGWRPRRLWTKMRTKVNVKKILLRLYGFSVSLKLSVAVFVLLGVLTAVGTYIESLLDQETANRLIYHSFLMTGTLGLLALNLSAALVDRWPWKARHIPFILAHFGILIMIFGAGLTRRFGVDGSLRIKEGETAEGVSLQAEEVTLYSSFDGENFSQIQREAVDFYLNRPSPKKPFPLSAGRDTFLIDGYIPYAILRQSFQETGPAGGRPALRFHLEGQRGSFVEWLFLPHGQETQIKEFGPARIVFTTDLRQPALIGKNKNPDGKETSRLKQPSPTGKNTLFLYVRGKRLFYSLEKRKKRPLKPGRAFSTGWMDFQFRLLEFFPKARRVFEVTPAKRPSDNTLPAVAVSRGGRRIWTALGAYTQFYEKDKMFAFGYLNRTHPLGFSIKLLDFRIRKYQGSDKAKSYESEVEVFGKKHIISMNQPLKVGGYTFYQSGFEEGEEGRKTASILSVNKDPGRFVKYAGGALVVLGMTLLFYRRKKLFGRKL